MENKVTEIYEKFNVNRKNYDALQADIQDLEELKKLEQEIKLNAK
jgi:predicted regulator of amino acid metabolism with ACT domain